MLGQVRQELSRLVREQGEVPLAVRVVVTGRCLAHREWAAAPEAWMNQIRAVAAGVGSGRVWIEKVKFRTAEPVPENAVAADDGPLLELKLLVEELQGDEPRLLELGDELAALRKKLPAELLSDVQGEDPLRFDEPAFWRSALAEVEPLLRARLLAEEGGP